MLTKVGGQGFTIRSNAQKLCGTFRAFRARVGELRPWLGPKAQPRTSDGVLLDSFQEVAVYERLRRALPPEVSIVPHVLLDPALPHRSADFLVSGTVYVEVLMVSLADMASPHGRTQQQYAGKWQCKAAWYAAQNKSLVIIEPDDILAADRLAGKIDQMRSLVGLSAPANGVDRARGSAPSVSTVRPKGYWTFDTLCQVVAEVARVVGGFPTHADLIAAGEQRPHDAHPVRTPPGGCPDRLAAASPEGGLDPGTGRAGGRGLDTAARLLSLDRGVEGNRTRPSGGRGATAVQRPDRRAQAGGRADPRADAVAAQDAERQLFDAGAACRAAAADLRQPGPVSDWGGGEGGRPITHGLGQGQHRLWRTCHGGIYGRAIPRPGSVWIMSQAASFVVRKSAKPQRKDRRCTAS